MKKTEFDRTFYLKALIKRKHNGLVKIVTGIRRCGKSYLLTNLFKRHLLSDGVKEDHIVEINLEDKKSAFLRNPNKLHEYVLGHLPNDGKWTYVFIDEIQFCRKVLLPGIVLKEVAPEDRDTVYVTFYDILNELMKLPKVDVYVTGSNSRMLSTDIATNFRDRGCEIRLFPLTFAEYYAASRYEKAEAFEHYLLWGGMPLAVIESDDGARAQYLKNLFKKVYLKDVRERNKLRGDHVSECVLDALCSSVGSLTNPHKLVKTLDSQGHVRTTDRTMKKYLGYFEDAFLFSKADRYDVRGKRYLEYPKKYYATDVGLRNARLNFRQIDEAHLMENVIYNELIARGCNVDVGVVEVRRSDGQGGKTLYQLEIDFVVNIDVRKVYVQSAFRMPDEAKMIQETASLRASGDFFRKIVVVSGFKPPQQDDSGIVHVGVIPFLLDKSILLG